MKEVIQVEKEVFNITLSIKADEAIKILEELTKSINAITEKIESIKILTPTVNVSIENQSSSDIDSIVNRITSTLEGQITSAVKSIY
jgi:phage-related protein